MFTWIPAQDDAFLQLSGTETRKGSVLIAVSMHLFESVASRYLSNNKTLFQLDMDLPIYKMQYFRACNTCKLYKSGRGGRRTVMVSLALWAAFEMLDPTPEAVSWTCRRQSTSDKDDVIRRSRLLTDKYLV